MKIIITKLFATCESHLNEGNQDGVEVGEGCSSTNTEIKLLLKVSSKIYFSN